MASTSAPLPARILEDAAWHGQIRAGGARVGYRFVQGWSVQKNE